MNDDDLYPCIGVCLPDADAAYCIGCGRPWGTPRDAPVAVPPAPSSPAAPDREREPA